MANYLMNYKGKWKLMPELTLNQDFATDISGNIDEDMIYIPCYYGCKIWYYGLSDNRRALLGAYIPSTGRGHNVKKAMVKDKVEIVGYDESSEEVTIVFHASDVEYMATLLKARTSGANTSPFSNKNLPKSDYKIPEEDLNKYKNIVSCLDKSEMLVIKRANDSFLNDVLEKKVRKDTKNKKYSYKDDMTSMKMTRQAKEFIHSKGFWGEYLNYLASEIDKFYNNK